MYNIHLYVQILMSVLSIMADVRISVTIPSAAMFACVRMVLRETVHSVMVSTIACI